MSEACTHCYAETLANRFRPASKLWRGNRERTKDWTKPLAWSRKAERDGVQRRIFPSMCDPFEAHPLLIGWRFDLWRLVEATPSLTWLLLTKRPENVLAMVPPSWIPGGSGGWPANVWVGATVENQERLDERAAHLVRIPAPVLFLSCEPLLGPIDAERWLGDNYSSLAGGFDHGIRWVIAGGESGPKARATNPAWARSLRDQCAAAGVPFLWKQWGEWAPGTDSPWSGVGQATTHTPKGEQMVRRGKTAAGRLLDGVQHDGVPEVTP